LNTAGPHPDNQQSFRLRVFALGKEVLEDGRQKLLEISRGCTSQIDLLLPCAAQVAESGWVPEIVYRTAELNILSIAVKFARAAATGVGIAAPSARSAPPQQDKPGSSQPEAVFEATFENREVKINGFRLSRPNFNSENEVVFDYLFRNPNRKIEISEIEAAVGRPLSKRLREIVRDLGFRKELREIFFPDISKSAIRFVNPITKADVDARELRPPSIEVR